MNIIALLTDFGYKDGFVGAMKGVIKTINPSVEVIDISHDISPFSILEASLILYSTYKYFPKNTIFVCVVDPGVGTNRKPLIVHTENYFFVLPDNGLITLVLKEEKVRSIYEITNRQFMLRRISQTFHGRDIFAPVSAYISVGVPLNLFGKKISIKEIKLLNFPEPKVKNGEIVGEILYFDRFGNAITNIPYKYLPENFIISFRNFKINKLSQNFLEGEKNQPNAIIGSTGLLELFLPEENFKEKFLAKKGEKIIIQEEK